MYKLWRHIREWSIAPLILNLGIRWSWVVSFLPRPFYPPGKTPRYRFRGRLGGPMLWSKRKRCHTSARNPTTISRMCSTWLIEIQEFENVDILWHSFKIVLKLWFDVDWGFWEFCVNNNVDSRSMWLAVGAFAKLRRATVASSCPSVCPHGKTRLPLDGFSLTLIFDDFFENLSIKFMFY